MSNNPGSITGKTIKKSEDKQTKIFLIPKTEDIKKNSKSRSINPTQQAAQPSTDKKTTNVSIASQSRQILSGKTSNRQQQFYQTWISGAIANINPLHPVLKTNQDQSTMSTTMNQSEAVDARNNNENREMRVDTFGQKSPPKQDNSSDGSISFRVRSVEKQTYKYSKLEEILNNPRGSINSDSKSVVVSQTINDPDSILRKSPDARLSTPAKSVNKSFGSMSFSLSGLKDVALAEAKARDKSSEIQRLINTFGVQQKYVQEDETLSKIKWRNPYKQEIDHIMKPKIIAATKIQKKFRSWIQHMKFRRCLRAIRRIQRKFRGSLFKEFEVRSRLEHYLQREGRTFNRIRAEEMKSLETDHKTNIADEDVRFSINEYYNSIVSERETLEPYRITTVDYQLTQSVEDELKTAISNATVSDLEFFTRIIDLDVLTDSREVNSKLWIDQYYHVTENLSADAPIHTIEVGETFSLVVNSKNKVFTWGLNQEHLLGVRSSECKGLFKQIQEEMGSTRLKMIAVADDHTIALDHDSDVYVWGDNTRGKLGVGIDDQIVYPIRLLTLPKGQVDYIATKGSHSVALTVSGEVITWPVARKVTKTSEKVSGGNIPMQLNMPCSSVTKVSCGYNFVMFVGSNGLIYGMGDNQYGQLGLGDHEQREKPEPVEFFKAKGEKCMAVSCGFKHVVFLSGLGRVYTWGSGHFGQLGHVECSDVSIPTEVHFEVNEYGLRMNQIQAGMRSSYALTEDHRLLCWGTNGRFLRQSSPAEIKLSELFPESINYIDKIPVKLCSKWSKTINVTYIVVGKFNKTDSDTLALKRKTLFNLGKKWEDQSIDPPQMIGLDKYFRTEYSKNLTLLGLKKLQETGKGGKGGRSSKSSAANSRASSLHSSPQKSRTEILSQMSVHSQSITRNSPPKFLQAKEMLLSGSITGVHLEDTKHSCTPRLPLSKRYDETELKLLELRNKHQEIKAKPMVIRTPAEHKFMKVMKEPKMAQLLARLDLKK